MGEARFRASFLRLTLLALQRESGGRAVEQLAERLPTNLRPMLSHLASPSAGGDPLVSLESAEEFLLGVEAVLGDGSGAVLERLGQALATQDAAAHSNELGRADVYDCTLRLSHDLVHAFVGCRMRFDLVRTDTGFNVSFGVSGYPRATRALRYLTLGTVRAAFTFAFEPTSSPLKVYSHIVGDRAEITARYRAADDQSDITPPPSSGDRSRPTVRPSVALEVERILSHAPRQPSAQPRRAVSGILSTPVPEAPPAHAVIPKAPRVPRLDHRVSHEPPAVPREPAPTETLQPGAPVPEAWRKTR